MASKFSLSKIFEKLGAKEVVHHSNDDSIEIRMDTGATVKFNDSADALRYALQQDMKNDANRQRSKYLRAMSMQADPAINQQLMQDYQQFLAMTLGQSGRSTMFSFSQAAARPSGPLTPVKAFAHPMTTPPLFKPFSSGSLFGEGHVAMVRTEAVQYEEIDDSDAWPAKTEAPWTVEYGQVHKLMDLDIVVNARPPIVLGVDPLCIAWYARLVYTAVQCDQSMPQTLEMVQLAGSKRLESAIRALPGIGGEAYLGVTDHLMFGDKPWCKQFQHVLGEALRPGFSVPDLRYDSVSDQRVVYLDRSNTVPLRDFLRSNDESGRLRIVRNMVAFWREAHPVAMDWKAVT